MAFWQELRHGRVRAARTIAGKLAAMPNPHGRTEFDFRCSPHNDCYGTVLRPPAMPPQSNVGGMRRSSKSSR